MGGGRNGSRWNANPRNTKLVPCGLSKCAGEFLESFIKSERLEEGEKINLYLSQNRLRMKKSINGKNDRETPLLAEILRQQKGHTIQPENLYNSKMQTILDQLIDRNEKLAYCFKKKKSFKLHIPGRLLLGEGGVSPYAEYVLYKFHPLYGVPYIPASTIKGLLRSSWNTLFVNGKENQQEAEQREQQLFGGVDSKESLAKLIFFDTYPSQFALTLDIQTPHYGEYYQGEKEPTDDQKLVPITLICLKDVRFKMWIACEDSEVWTQEEQNIHKAVQCMVEEYGIGAKTALGYGIGSVS